MVVYGLSNLGVPLGDRCTVDILIEPESGPLEFVADLGLEPNRPAAVASVVRWAKANGATVSALGGHADADEVTLPVTLADGRNAQAFIHHDTSNLDLDWH